MIEKLVLAAAMLTVVVAYSVPTTAYANETTIVAQAEEKAKNKDIDKEKEKGKKGKAKGKKGKDKDKGKDEEWNSPTSGGISGGYAAVLAVGAGALILGGVLLVRGRWRSPSESEA